MKTKIKRHSRSVLSVVLALCMLLSCMTAGMIMTDAAKVDSESVGYDTYYVKGSWDKDGNGVWNLHNITTNVYSVNLEANKTYSFVFMANNDQFSSNVTIKNTTNYNFSKNSNDAITLQTAAAGTYKFSCSGMDGGQTSMSVRIEFPVDTTPTSWTAVGDSTALFGTAWAPTANANDLTKGSGTTWSKTWTDVQLTGGSTIKYKVAKNHAWTTTYPSSNATATVPGTGTGLYNVEVTYNESGNAVNMTITPATTYTLKVPTVANAVVKASYNGNTVNEGGTLSGILAGEEVTISVTPDAGYSCTGVSSTPPANVTGSGRTWKLTMPSDNVTNLTVTLGTESTKRVYFYNVNTEYAMVSAYVDYSETKPFGAYPGKTMTRLDNSNVWYVDVPEGATDITFIGDNGYNTGSLTIPSTTNPMYTAGSDKQNPATGGTWGTYTVRNNEYTVSKGSTLTNNTNLFTGITATMYDYYVDGEITGSNGWLQDIGGREYSQNDGNNFNWNPFTKLNRALSDYAAAKGVTYPLYFGNLNTRDINNVTGGTNPGMKNTIEGYTNWNFAINNSIGLSEKHNAVTGLTGQTIQNDNTRHYKKGVTNENGAPMAFFDEDFLSGINSQNTTLATILRSAAFPVRKTTEGATTTYPNRIYVSAGAFEVQNDGGKLWAHFYTGNTNKGDVQMTYDSSSGYYYCDIPSGSPTGVTFVRTSSAATGVVWSGSNFWNKSGDYAVETSTSSASRLYTFSSYNNDVGQFSKGDIAASYGTTSGGHVYYEFDSTGGKDNAYVRNINKTNKTAELDYYAASDNKKVLAATTSGGQNGDPGFYPFDYNDYQSNINNLAHDLGFGMKLEIPFTIDANGINSTDNTHQVFRFSGDDDLWVYIDGHLVLDLGGAHLQTEGEIDFATTTVTANKKQSVDSGFRNGNFGSWFDNTKPNAVHTMTIYYMERGMFDSNLKFGFSFHAIPNQLKVEKKVRTANVNSGFYIVNSTTQSDYTVDNGRAVTWFEKSYQYEGFNVIQTSGAAPKTPTSVQYTMDQAPGTTQAGSTQMTSTTSSSNNYQLGYTLRNDFTAYFMNQYNSNTPITLKEAFNSGNMYRYTPSVTVYDDANNKKEFTTTTGTPAAGQVKGNATDGATFLFAETHNTGIENLNLRARFTNQMNTHDLYIYKKTNVTDKTTQFKLNIKFKTDSTEYTPHGFTAYPLYCSLDGEDRQLSETGDIAIKAGQELIIPKIPENAQIQIIETLPNDSAYTYSGTDLAYTSGVSVEPDDTDTSGIQFTMGTDDMKATVNNKQSDPVMISHNLKPGSVGDADTYVTAVVTDNEGTTKKTYEKTPRVIIVDPSYIKKGSTDKLVITLDTTPIGPYAFESFWEDIRRTMEELRENGVKYTATIDTTRMTAEVKIVIGDLFDSTTGVQLYTELPFYSSLEDLQRSLTITKKLTGDTTDASAAFTVNVTKNGEAYTGNYKKGGTTYQTNNGIFTMHQNDTIIIEGLRVGENVAVYETNIPFNYQFSKATLGTDDATNVASGDATGYAFTVREDTALTIWNALIEYQYELTYSYSSYRNLHQTQKYKYSGTFNANTDKVNTYLTVSDQVPDADNHGNTCTAYWFMDDNARKNFINILGPYENNYMKLLYWNTDMRSNSNPNGVSIVYTSTNHKYTIDVNATVSEDNYVDLHFKFPYAHDVRGNGYAAIETDGKVVEDTTQETEDIPNLDYMTWYAVNSYKSYEEAAAHDTVPQFVAAPKVIYDGDTPKYFRYWTVKTVPTDNDYQGVEYTKCYYYEFNLTIYQDSIVEPVYKALTAEEVAAGYTPSPHAEAIKDGNANGAVVTFIENSRNRYNVYNSNVPAETRRSKGDRIYNDFLLSYASESDLQYRTFDEGTYTAGIAIQRVARLDTNGDDVITDTAYYAEKYGSSTDTMTFVAPGTDTKTAFNKTVLQNFVKGNATYNDDFGLESSQFDATRLDNKNRIQYYYSYSIKSHSDLTVDTGNKDYVYRAFAYMIDNTTHEIELLSEAPLYYTFYDMASIANAQDGYEIDFPSDP